jgi:hypothetical protein
MPYAILRTAKLKTAGNIGGLNDHLHRLRETPNADQELTYQNQRLRGSDDLAADVQNRLDAAGCTVRKNAVLAVEHVLTVSPEFLNFHKGEKDGRPALMGNATDRDRLSGFRDRALEWVDERYGENNVVSAVLHLDEKTPHLHIVVVPLDERSKLNCRSYLGGKDKMRAMQTSFAEKMEPLGLVRGVEGSKSEHQTIQRFYGLVKELTPGLEKEAQTHQQEQANQVVQQRIDQANKAKSKGMSQGGGRGM